MGKRLEEMAGVPPAERMRFASKRYRTKAMVEVTDAEVEYLIRLVEQESKIRSRFPQQLLGGVADFLKNPSVHQFEGRAGHYAKRSFAKTELQTALSFKNDGLKLKYLIYRFKFAEYPQKKIVDDFPIIVAIEPTSWCNLRCIMCSQADRRFFTDRQAMGFMDMGLYRQLIDEMADNQSCSLVLASRGEPMLHQNFIEMVAYATRKGIIDVKINTNATRLTEEKSRKLLAAEPTTMVFSVDASNEEEFEAIRPGANFDKVVANIRLFNEIREREFPDSRTRTRISMTVFRKSQNLEEAENLWAGMVDEFSVKSADYRLDIYNHPALPCETRACNLLWERLYVWWNGQVNPCDTDYKSHLCLGEVGKGQSIKSIWLGDRMQKMRSDHLAGRKNDYFPCSQCYGF